MGFVHLEKFGQNFQVGHFQSILVPFPGSCLFGVCPYIIKTIKLKTIMLRFNSL